MSTRAIIVLVLVGLALLVFLAPAQAQPTPSSSPPTPGDGGLADALHLGANVTDLLKGQATTFLAPGGGVISTGGMAAPGIPANTSPSPYAPPVYTNAPPVAAAAAQQNAAAAYLGMPGTDVKQAVLRGWGRFFVSGIPYSNPAQSLNGKQNLSPGVQPGSVWNYSGPTYGDHPTISEWNAFDAARRSLLAGR